MNETNESPVKPVYRWPWFLLGAVILAIVLAIVWMSFAVAKTRRLRDSNSFPPAPRPVSPVGNTNQSSQLSLTNDSLAGFRSALSGGNANAGRKIFFEKPEASCGKCHKVAGQGSDTGPALDGIGARQTREYILESMISPNCRTLPGYESVIILLKSGTGCSGFLKSEDETNLVIHTPEDGLMTVKKSDIQIRQKGLSPMPEGLGQILSKQDLSDLVEYIASLKQ
jgi:putative heme-binding domain-containing protein